MEVKDKKIIVNIPAEKLDILERASKLENRPRNNFILTSALQKANELLEKEKSNRGDNGTENIL